MISARRWIRAVSVAALAAAATACATQQSAPRDTFDLSEFCTEAQQIIAGTTLRAENVLHVDKQAFAASKPSARPLRTEQFIAYEDEARALPKIVSCKMKTSDHIATEYGAEATRGEGLCADINRHTLERVLRSMSAAEQRRLLFKRGTHVVFDAEERTTDGSVWLAPFPLTSVGADGALHIKTRSMRNDWLDPALAQAPARFKGTRYCHLITPQYLARLLRGATLPDEHP
jgi:hypothetical protein